MRYRIRESEGWFYPEYKRLWYWVSFDKNFPCLSEAEKFLIEITSPAKKDKIHPFHPFPD